jgi:CRP-like cAMP-binding protein
MKRLENTQRIKVQKGTILLYKGELCNHGYKVISGCLRSYAVDGTGKEHIIQFAPEEWLIADLDSLINRKPSAIFIDALEDTEIIRLATSDFEDLIVDDLQELQQMNLKLLRNIVSANRRLISLLSYSAEERYLQFIQTYPTLTQRLPLKLIASYLGITPEYLSEVRRKLAKK